MDWTDWGGIAQQDWESWDNWEWDYGRFKLADGEVRETGRVVAVEGEAIPPALSAGSFLTREEDPRT